VTAAGPLRGPVRTKKEAAAPPLISGARRAGYGAAPPASRVLRIALRATALRAALDPGDLGGPWRQEERSGQGLPPGQARGAQAPSWRASAGPEARNQSELAFDNQKKRRNYTKPGPDSRSGNLITAEPPGKAASHETRCA
jgi:hypothetical protein